jgi:transcriptional regulator with XRE-family HTH domain
METFATLVQQGREAAGLSYQRVAELVGRAPSTIRGWERGRSEPKDAEVVIALAAVLDLPEDVLLESVELSRSSSSIGGSFSDLAPSDLGEPGAVPAEVDEAVVVDAGVSGETRPLEGPQEVGEAQGAEPRTDESITHDDGVVPREAALPRSEPVRRPVRAETHRTAIPPQSLLVQPTQRSYLEDRRQMTTYRIRALLTVGILLALLLLVEWGLHGAGLSLKDALSGLHP